MKRSKLCWPVLGLMLMTSVGCGEEEVVRVDISHGGLVRGTGVNYVIDVLQVPDGTELNYTFLMYDLIVPSNAVTTMVATNVHLGTIWCDDCKKKPGKVGTFWEDHEGCRGDRMRGYTTITEVKTLTLTWKGKVRTIVDRKELSRAHETYRLKKEWIEEDSQ